VGLEWWCPSRLTADDRSSLRSQLHTVECAAAFELTCDDETLVRFFAAVVEAPVFEVTAETVFAAFFAVVVTFATVAFVAVIRRGATARTVRTGVTTVRTTVSGVAHRLGAAMAAAAAVAACGFRAVVWTAG
jgi:hypothetical protein